MNTRTDRVLDLARRLEERILSGQAAPGEALPSERDLSASYGVSRSVVREAIRTLASQGMVRSVHGSGTWIEPPSGRPISLGIEHMLRRSSVRLEDLAEVRLPLESAIAEIAARRRTPQQLDRLAAAQAVLGDPERDLADHVRADLEFHAVLAEATGNPFFGIVLAPIQELLIESRRRTLGRHGADLAHRHHQRIFEAVRDHDPAAALAAMRDHILANWKHLHGDGEIPPAPDSGE